MILQSLPVYNNIVSFLRKEILPIGGPHHRGIQLWVAGTNVLLSNPLLHESVYHPDLNQLLENPVTKEIGFHIIGEDEVSFCLQRSGNGFTLYNKKCKNPDIAFSMKSDIFFAVFTGKLNPDKAVIAGKILYEGSLEHLGFALHFFHVLQAWYKGNEWWQQAYRELVDLSQDLKPT
ncbi:MAG: hypothetical protein D6767_07500 [Candidatus Hydrogenedentota bacterium]|nr:MAG: hypothetical protein D6767_07500 [Candidatus Hydrogenedentota bacterium]